jgi:hypothetical protein
MKLPVTALLPDPNPTVGLQAGQQFMNRDRHAPIKILPRGLVPAMAGNRRLVRNPEHSRLFLLSGVCSTHNVGAHPKQTPSTRVEKAKAATTLTVTTRSATQCATRFAMPRGVPRGK